jgi:thymidylate kinase
MLIVFEGGNQVGKSTLSVEFQNYLNTEYSDGKGGIIIDPEKGPFVWTKEPSFTTAEADKLNGLKDPSSQYKRELMFFESRITHQNFLSKYNIICDRYVWSGMAYARVYSPGCYEMLRELYQSKKLFIQPDLYVYVNTNIDVCLKRDPSLDMDTLLALWKSYELVYDNIKKLDIPVITINCGDRSNNEEESVLLVLQELAERFKAHLKLTSKAK